MESSVIPSRSIAAGTCSNNVGLLDLIRGARAARKLERGEVDTTGKEFAPVKGVDVDRYAHICKRLADANKAGRTDEASLNQLLASEGINPADWLEIANAWNDRVMNNMAVKMRYSQTFLTGG